MEVTVVAADGARLAADLLVPDAPRHAALIAPAMGVPRGFYRPFAEFLAEGGVASLILDYRGLGGSAAAAGRDVAIHDWADLDLPAAIAHLRAAVPGVPLAWIGHSIGGQLFGLVESPPVSRALFVAAQHGHWRNWHGWPRWGMAALWWAVIPAFVRLTGHLPMRRFGQGEDLPPEVAREWARWGRDREYIVGFARARGPRVGFASYRGPLRAYAIADDRYAPASTVRPLVEAFAATRGEVIEARPRDHGAAHLGHFGCFRPPARRLWEEWRGWLTTV